MRDREQRLHWIEKLIDTEHPESNRNTALVIPTSAGNMAVAFSSLVEVQSADNVQPFAFLPKEFCGVVRHGNTLAPVIDTGGTSGVAAHVVLAEGSGCLLGLRFRGAPFVVDLDETEHETLEIRHHQDLRGDKLPLLDVDATVDALLAKD